MPPLAGGSHHTLQPFYFNNAAVRIKPTSTPGRKYIGQTALQPVQDLLQSLEGNGLLTILQSEQAGRRDPQLLGKLSIRRLPPPLPKELAQLFVQCLPHIKDAGQSGIPFAEYFA